MLRLLEVCVFLFALAGYVYIGWVAYFFAALADLGHSQGPEFMPTTHYVAYVAIGWLIGFLLYVAVVIPWFRQP